MQLQLGVSCVYVRPHSFAAYTPCSCWVACIDSRERSWDGGRGATNSNSSSSSGGSEAMIHSSRSSSRTRVLEQQTAQYLPGRQGAAHAGGAACQPAGCWYCRPHAWLPQQ
jgi:hypothetical protein